MTPNDIEILIHCHVSPTKHPRSDAPAVIESIADFVHKGMLIEKTAGIYHTTDKGSSHVEQLCSLPVPVKQFIDYNGKVITI